MNNKAKRQLAAMIFLLIVMPIVFGVYELTRIFSKNSKEPSHTYNDTNLTSDEGIPPARYSTDPAIAGLASETVVLNAPVEKTVDKDVKIEKPTSEKIQQVRRKMKSTLVSIYAAQTTFFAEYNRYSVDFKETGFSLDMNSSKLDFKFGFIDSDSDQYIEPNQYSNLSKQFKLQDVRKFCKAGCTIRADGFEAIIATNLDNDSDLDVWTINEKKEMEHVFDDLAPPK